MAKQTSTPQKFVQRSYPEDVLRKNVALVQSVEKHIPLLPDDDKPSDILTAAVNELMELRQAVEEIKGPIQVWLTKHTRR
jgi:hypothetical protein